MQTTTKDETTVTLTFTLAELATINEALAMRCSVSTFPRPGYSGDRLNEEDYDRANRLEKHTFALYVTYQERAEYAKHDDPID